MVKVWLAPQVDDIRADEFLIQCWEECSVAPLLRGQVQSTHLQGHLLEMEATNLHPGYCVFMLDS